MSYLSHGNLTGGFALVAYPEHWDQSGIMTFIVNQDGEVFQQNLGVKTSQLAGAMKAYNPDSAWTLVQDERGIGCGFPEMISASASQAKKDGQHQQPLIDVTK